MGHAPQSPPSSSPLSPTNGHAMSRTTMCSYITDTTRTTMTQSKTKMTSHSYSLTTTVYSTCHMPCRTSTGRHLALLSRNPLADGRKSSPPGKRVGLGSGPRARCPGVATRGGSLVLTCSLSMSQTKMLRWLCEGRGVRRLEWLVRLRRPRMATRAGGLDLTWWRKQDCDYYKRW
jgi:hypothetical protein